MTRIPDHDREQAVIAQKLRPVKERDSSELARRIRILPYCVIGMAFGAAIGARVFGVVGMILGAPVGFLLMYGTILGVLEGVGRAFAATYAPSGSRTPAIPEYSLAQSLIMREQYDAAVAQLEDDARENPKDVTPLLLLARLIRDRKSDHERAFETFRRALRVPALPAGIEHQVLRELVELAEHRMQAPARALPDLARYADTRRGTPAGDWARAELQRLKAPADSG